MHASLSAHSKDTFRLGLLVVGILLAPAFAFSGDCYYRINDCPAMGFDDLLVTEPDAAACAAHCTTGPFCPSPYGYQRSNKMCTYTR